MRIYEKPVEEIIRLRKSVRTFDSKPIKDEDMEKLSSHMKNLDNPFGVQVRVDFLKEQAGSDGRKLGTYGVIHGCSTYLGVAVMDGPLALEALGYSFEELILYCTELGLGTCWLGGTFRRTSFAEAMGLKSGELFPAVSPIGYPKVRHSLIDSLVRTVTKGDKRKPWEELFFSDDFENPLKESKAGVFRLPLELVRLAPSASNKQPWRIVKSGDSFHFFEAKTPGYSNLMPYDLQRIDLGIAACHFHLSMLEEGFTGRFSVIEQTLATSIPSLEYVFTWNPS